MIGEDLRSLFRRATSILEGRARRDFGKETRLLEKLLWSGRSREALPEIEALIEAPDVPVGARSFARAGLACWCYHNGDPERALSVLEAGLVGDKHALERAKFRRTLLALHIALGNFADAKVVLEKAGCAETTYDMLLRASAETDDDDRLLRLNEIFSSHGLSTLDRLRNEPLTFSTIRGSSQPKSIQGTETVSVIIPVYNRQDTLAYCVQSVCDQTYGNLEILIVDDASTDNSLRIAEALASQDNRISIIRHDQNRGAYVARNTGLAAASGDYITVQDSDDWSHPQRIELQMSEFGEDRLAVGSSWTRLTNDLRHAVWILSKKAPARNFWSVIFRRNVFDAIGEWDPIRFRADADFLRRLQVFAGVEKLHWIRESVPLAFGLFSQDSLTSMSQFEKSTTYNGPRFFSRCLTRHWYDTLGKVTSEEQDAKIALFPEVFIRKDIDVASVGLCLQGDFSKPERVAAAKQRIDAGTGTVALFNLPDFSVTRNEEFDLCAEYFELLQSDRVFCIFDLEDVSAEAFEIL